MWVPTDRRRFVAIPTYNQTVRRARGGHQLVELGAILAVAEVLALPEITDSIDRLADSIRSHNCDW